jgi:NADH-quinone oxidoreductase subunit E
MESVLTHSERREVEEALRHYADRRSGIVTALKIVQRHRGWISNGILCAVADLVGVSCHQAEARATFYNLIFREPVGDHVILVCDSPACWITGYRDLHKALVQHLGIDFGQTTPDKRFTLLPIVCLGACDRAPAMLVDADLHGPVLDGDLPGILAAYP